MLPPRSIKRRENEISKKTRQNYLLQKLLPLDKAYYMQDILSNLSNLQFKDFEDLDFKTDYVVLDIISKPIGYIVIQPQSKKIFCLYHSAVMDNWLCEYRKSKPKLFNGHFGIKFVKVYSKKKSVIFDYCQNVDKKVKVRLKKIWIGDYVQDTRIILKLKSQSSYEMIDTSNNVTSNEVEFSDIGDLYECPTIEEINTYLDKSFVFDENELLEYLK